MDILVQKLYVYICKSYTVPTYYTLHEKLMLHPPPYVLQNPLKKEKVPLIKLGRPIVANSLKG